MKLHDLLTKNATVELKHPVSDEVLGVSIVIKPNEDQGVKSVVRRELSNLPNRPADDAKDVEKLNYLETIEKTDRTILASRIVDVKGLEDFVNTEEAVLAFVMSLPAEYIAQINEVVSDRNNFFRGAK